jgi:1-acyl-sn-glycerol-3-phosphate acyltransferase
VWVGEPLPAPTGKGRAELAAATETVRGALAALVGELDELRSSA